MKGIWAVPVFASILILSLPQSYAESGNTTIGPFDGSIGVGTFGNPPYFGFSINDPDGIFRAEGNPFAANTNCANLSLRISFSFLPNVVTVTDCQDSPDVTVWLIETTGVTCIGGSCISQDTTPPVISFPGNILVVDSNAGTNKNGAIFGINPYTGKRIIVSDFGDSTKGPLGVKLSDITIDEFGNALVTGLDAASDIGVLFSINPVTGVRKTFSEYTTLLLDARPLGIDSHPVAGVMVVDPSASLTTPFSVIFNIDFLRNITIFSDFGNPPQGVFASTLRDLAIDVSGDVFVTGPTDGPSASGAIYEVEFPTGNQTVLSDFGNPAQGFTGGRPLGIGIDSAGALLVVDPEGSDILPSH